MLVEDLNMKRVSAKFIPRLLTEDQKNDRLNVCYDLREQSYVYWSVHHCDS